MGAGFWGERMGRGKQCAGDQAALISLHDVWQSMHHEMMLRIYEPSSLWEGGWGLLCASVTACVRAILAAPAAHQTALCWGMS